MISNIILATNLNPNLKGFDMVTPEQCKQEMHQFIDESLEEVFDKLLVAAQQGNSFLKIPCNELTNDQFHRLSQLGYGAEHSTALNEDTISWY